jgi:hypothetical protein
VRELGPREGRRITWHELWFPILGPGLYHPVKAVHHNRRLALRVLRRGAGRLGSALVHLAGAVRDARGAT